MGTEFGFARTHKYFELAAVPYISSPVIMGKYTVRSVVILIIVKMFKTKIHRRVCKTNTILLFTNITNLY